MFSVKQGAPRNFTKFTRKCLCQSLFFNKVAGLKKATLAQVLSCEFCEISKNTFSYGTPLVAASVRDMWSGAKNKDLIKLKANLLRIVLKTKFKALAFKAFSVLINKAIKKLTSNSITEFLKQKKKY